MSREIHLTRGAGFGDAGEEPLSRSDWDAVAESFSTVILRKPGSRLGRVDGRPIVFNEGLIALTSPSKSSVQTMLELAKSLGARLFAADGAQLETDEKRPGAFVIRACGSCSAKNRLPFFAPQGQQPKCGRCKKPLAG